MGMRSPLGRVLGLGSARDGTGHWWNQRLTAVALVPLGLWFAWSLVALPDRSHPQVIDWVASPLNTVALLLLVIFTSWHAKLGVQVVIEDYVSAAWLKVAALVLNTLVFLAAGVTGGFAVLRISFGVAP